MLVGVHAFASFTNNFPSIITTGQTSYGAVNLAGGSMTLYSKLLIGNCPTGGVGVVDVAGGSLYVTNAAHNAFIDVRSGQLNLNGGLLQTDILIMTNVCGLFVRDGGTLVVGSVVLDPNLSALGDGIPNGWKQAYGFDPLDPSVGNKDADGDGFSNLQEYQAGTDPTNSASAFQISSIVRTGSDVLVSWVSGIGKTNALQMTTGVGDGSYATNNFANLFVVTNTTSFLTNGMTNFFIYFGGPTNYLDAGAVTNSAARFYRIKLVAPP
jgi:hypothetical protein